MPQFHTDPASPIRELSHNQINLLNHRTVVQDLGIDVELRGRRGQAPVTPFLEFDDASDSVLKILRSNLYSPTYSREKIEQESFAVKALHSVFQQIEEGPAQAINTFKSLLASFSVTVSNFRRELRTARDKTYPLRAGAVNCNRSYQFYRPGGEKDNCFADHWAPYPIVARPAIQIIRAVACLKEISKFLSNVDNDEIQRIKNKIDNHLSRKELSDIVSANYILDNINLSLNPYLAVKDSDFDRMQKDRFPMYEEYYPDYDYKKSFANYMDGASDRDSFMHRQELCWYKEAKVLKGEESSSFYSNVSESNPELANLIGDQLRGIFSNLDNLHHLEESSRISFGKPGHRVAKHPFLTSFTQSIDASLIPRLGYLTRVADMLNNGAIFADTDSETHFFDLKSYKNTLIREECFIEPKNDMIALLLGKSRTKPSYRVSAIPVSLSISKANPNLFLSGPNNAAKTVNAQNIGTAQLLTQAKLPIFAEEATVPISGRVFTAFSSRYQYKEGLGHLAITLEKLREISDLAKPGDTVIVDELPAGTNYNELIEIGYRIYKSLMDKGVVLIATNHVKQTLVMLEEELGANVQKTQIRNIDGELQADYQPVSGVAEHSYGIELMNSIGFSDEIVNRAREHYAELTGNTYPSFKEKLKVVTEEQGNILNEGLLEAARLIYDHENFVFNITKISFAMIVSGFKEPESFCISDLGKAGETIELKKIKREDRIANAKSRVLALNSLLTCLDSDLRKIQNELKVFADLALRTTSFHYEVSDYDMKNVHKTIKCFLEFLNSKEDFVQLNLFETAIEVFSKFLDSGPKDCVELSTFEEDSTTDNSDENLSNPQTNEFNQDSAVENLSQVSNWKMILTFFIPHLYSLDLLIGSARVINKHNLQAPTLTSERGMFEMKKAKPYLPHNAHSYDSLFSFAEPKVFIEDGKEIEFEVGASNQISVVFGPNSTGKTTFGFNAPGNANLALNGFFTPSEIKISEDLEVLQFLGVDSRSTRGKSLYKNTLESLKGILDQAQAQAGTMIFLDELKGTDFVEIAATQNALIDYCSRNGIILVYNTHVKDGLEQYKESPNVTFFSTDYKFDSETFELTPNYGLVPDPNLESESHGMSVAKKYFPELF